jgi:hypothetical protein
MSQLFSAFIAAVDIVSPQALIVLVIYLRQPFDFDERL